MISNFLHNVDFSQKLLSFPFIGICWTITKEAIEAYRKPNSIEEKQTFQLFDGNRCRSHNAVDTVSSANIDKSECSLTNNPTWRNVIVIDGVYSLLLLSTVPSLRRS